LRDFDTVGFAAETTAIHIIFELAALQQGQNGDNPSSIRNLIQSYLDWRFRSDKRLLKLLLFQGFPLSTIPMVITQERISDTLLGHLKELILFPSDCEKTMFGIHCTAYTARLHPTPEM
jgi:hypothetical protein